MKTGAAKGWLVRAGVIVLVGMAMPSCTSRDPSNAALLSSFATNHPDAIVIGELHGTSEVPQWFGNLVDDFVKSGVPANVGVELSEADIASSCGALAGSSRGAGRWFDEVQDGRTSRAMAQLTCALTKLRDRGEIRLYGLVSSSQAMSRSQRYADVVATAHKQHPAISLILVGNLHAKNAPTSLAGILKGRGLTVETAAICRTRERSIAAKTIAVRNCIPVDDSFTERWPT